MSAPHLEQVPNLHEMNRFLMSHSNHPVGHAQYLGLSTVTVYGYDRKHYGWYTGTVPPYPSP
jgi:hypothetical protein